VIRLGEWLSGQFVRFRGGSCKSPENLKTERLTDLMSAGSAPNAINVFSTLRERGNSVGSDRKYANWYKKNQSLKWRDLFLPTL
jgi:hypothetical protein